MRKIKIAAALAAGVLAALGAVSVAQATGDGSGCPVTTYGDVSHVTVSGGASATVTDAGLRLKTPEQPSRARFQLPQDGTFANLTALSYKTKTYSDGDRGFATVAARVGLDTNSDDAADVTLVYEPYFNGTVAEGGDWQTWDAVDSGAAKWWWAEEPGNPQTNRTWSHWQETYPAATIVFVNVGMGTWNEGADAKVNSLRVRVKNEGCFVVRWQKSTQATPTATPTATATPSATPSPTATATAAPSLTVTTRPSTTPVAGGGQLPVTGVPVWALVGAGGLLVALGCAALFVKSRRERTRFEA